MADSLETEVGRFDYYKKKLEEEKATVPQLTQAPPEVVELAMSQANRDIFPPMGFINFNKVPDGVDKEKYLGFKVDDILRGTVQYIHYLQSQPPAYLQGWGISRLPIYKESDAAKNLVAKTKVSYSKLSEEMSNIEDGETPEFSDPVMNKLSSKDIQNLLDSSILEFLKEIGVNRTEGGVKQNDDLILESSQKIYDFLTSSNNTTSQAISTLTDPDAITTKLEEPPIKVKEAEKMEPVPTSPPEPPAPPVTLPQQTPTVVEKSQPPIEPAQPSVPAQNTTTTEPANIATAEPANIATPETTNQPVATLSDVPFTETGGSVSGSASVSTPLLDMLASSSGMNSDEIAKMFQNQTGDSGLQLPGDIPVPITPSVGTIEETIAQTSALNSVQTIQQTPSEKAASLVSEPTKMAEPMPPVVTQQTPIQAEAPSKPTTAPESTTPADQATTGSESKENTAKQEEKSTEGEKSKEEDPNAELLRVMRDVLKTLQGPLIVTDGKHNFS